MKQFWNGFEKRAMLDPLEFPGFMRHGEKAIAPAIKGLVDNFSKTMGAKAPAAGEGFYAGVKTFFRNIAEGVGATKDTMNAAKDVAGKIHEHVSGEQAQAAMRSLSGAAENLKDTTKTISEVARLTKWPLAVASGLAAVGTAATIPGKLRQSALTNEQLKYYRKMNEGLEQKV